MMPRWCTASAFGLALASSTPALAQDAGVCVRDVPVVANPEFRAADAAPDLSLTGAPTNLRAVDGAPFPVASEPMPLGGPLPPPLGRPSRHVFYQFRWDGSIAGPHDTGFSVDVAYLHEGRVAADSSGRIAIIGARYEATAGGRRWIQRLFLQVPGGYPERPHAELEAIIGEASAVYFSRLLNGIAISSRSTPTVEDATRRTGQVRGDARRTVLLQDGVTEIATRDFDLAQDFLRLGLVAILSRRELAFLRPGDPQPVLVVGLNSGDDFNGWEALHETSDPGWLYIAGAQYHSALHVERSGEGWRVAANVRFAESGDFWDRLFGWLLGMDGNAIRRDQLTRIERAGPCRRFSPALGRMIFCDPIGGRMRMLRAGRLEWVSAGRMRLQHYVGDAVQFGVALFVGEDERLYAFDGTAVRPVQGPAPGRGLPSGIRSVQRVFYAAMGALFELRSNGGDLVLVPLDHPRARQPFWTRFFPLPGQRVLALMSEGIFLVENDRLRRIWSPREDMQVAVTSHVAPVEVPGWNGILFATGTVHNRELRFHLAADCGR